VFVCIQACCGQCEGPEEKVSRYIVRPGTLGSTLIASRVVKLETVV
jgi:hypothetical protein